MVFDSTSFRHLAQSNEYVRFNIDWSEKDYKISAYVFLPIGIFLVLQGHPRRKIVGIIMGFFLAFLSFGNNIISGKDTAAQGEAALKLIALGGVLGVASHYTQCLGQTIMGLFGGLLATMTMLVQLNQVTSSYTMDQLFKEYESFFLVAVMVGLIVPCVLREHIVMPLSLVLGTSLIIIALAIMDQGIWRFIFQN